jgi:hypothetical protein
MSLTSRGACYNHLIVGAKCAGGVGSVRTYIFATVVSLALAGCSASSDENSIEATAVPENESDAANRDTLSLNLDLDCTVKYFKDGVGTGSWSSGVLLSINSPIVQMKINASRWRLTGVSKEHIKFSSNQSTGILNRLDGSLMVVANHNNKVSMTGDCKKAVPKF